MEGPAGSQQTKGGEKKNKVGQRPEKKTIKEGCERETKVGQSRVATPCVIECGRSTAGSAMHGGRKDATLSILS